MSGQSLLTADTETWHRLSPRMLLVHPFVEIARALPALVGLFLAGRSQGHSYWGALAATAIVALFSLTRWFTTKLRITPDSVQLRRGLLRRQTVTTARDRIRTVDVTAHPLHRALGLARVVIGTGTNDRKREARLVLDGLTAAGAVRLRLQLLHRPTSDDPPAPASLEKVQTEHEIGRLDLSWIRFAPFTLSGVVTGLVIWGFYWRVQGESQVNLARSGPLHTAFEALRRLPLGGEIAVVAGGLIAFVAITSTVGYVLAFWNFRLVRHPAGSLQVRRGLLTTRATSIERRRLVGVTFTAPLPLRLVGAVRTTAVATGLRTGRGAERGGEVLLPPAPRSAAAAVVTLALGTAAVTASVGGHGPAARRRRLTRAVAAGAALLAAAVVAWAAGAPGWPIGAAAAVLLLCVPLGFDRAAALGHARSDGYLITQAGSLLRRRTVLDERGVIGWNLRSTWFQRRRNLTTLTATTAAGRQGYAVVDVPEPEALSVALGISSELVSQFRRAPQATSR